MKIETDTNRVGRKKRHGLAAIALAALLLLGVLLPSCSAGDGRVVMEYNGVKLYENMYTYWLATYKRDIMNTYSDARNEDFWTAEYTDGVTVEDYFTTLLNNRIKNYLIAQSLAKRYGVVLSSDVKSEINSDIKEKAEYAGGRAELNSELANIGTGMNITSLKTAYRWEKMYDAVFDYFYGDGGAEQLTAKQVADYYNENYSHIQYIVFYTTKVKTKEDGSYVYDSDGKTVMEDMTDEEKAAVLAKADECYEKSKAGDVDFIDLIKEYSDQDTTSTYPNGFVLSLSESDVWGTEITTKTLAADVGDVFRVDEEYCIFIIKKYIPIAFEKLTDTEINQIPDIESNLANETMQKKMDELYKDVTVNDEVLSEYRLSKIASNPYYAY